MATKKQAKNPGRKRGPKTKSGVYYQVPIRVTAQEELDAIFALSPEQRGAAILAGMKQVATA